MHDGSMVRFKGVPPNYDPTDRGKVMDYLEEHHGKGEVVTGLLYLDESVPDMHEMNKTTDVALTKVPYQKLCPGAAALDRLQEDFR
jgi:2-oxoglutarate ferredoxin oxidoreductase subunit beta